MCLVCVEIMKGNMTPSELIRADREIQAPHTEEELSMLAEFIERERPDLKEAIIAEYGSAQENV